MSLPESRPSGAIRNKRNTLTRIPYSHSRIASATAIPQGWNSSGNIIRNPTAKQSGEKRAANVRRRLISVVSEKEYIPAEWCANFLRYTGDTDRDASVSRPGPARRAMPRFLVRPVTPENTRRVTWKAQADFGVDSWNSAGSPCIQHPVAVYKRDKVDKKLYRPERNGERDRELKVIESRKVCGILGRALGDAQTKKSWIFGSMWISEIARENVWLDELISREIWTISKLELPEFSVWVNQKF